MTTLPKRRPRASPELMRALREGKATLRRQREKLELREKIRIVIELQRLCLPMIKRRRQLAAWEHPWATTP